MLYFHSSSFYSLMMNIWLVPVRDTPVFCRQMGRQLVGNLYDILLEAWSSAWWQAVPEGGFSDNQ